MKNQKLSHFLPRKFLTSIILLSGFFFLTSPVLADSAAGTVYAPFTGCDYFLIQDPTGTYSEVEWFGGVSPDNGDTVYGDFQTTYGLQDIYDQTQEGSSNLWVDDFWDSEDDALQYTMDNCDGYQFDPSVMPSDSGLPLSPTLPAQLPLTPSAPTPTQASCPENSTQTGSTCTCNTGYQAVSGVCVVVQAPTNASLPVVSPPAITKIVPAETQPSQEKFLPVKGVSASTDVQPSGFFETAKAPPQTELVLAKASTTTPTAKKSFWQVIGGLIEKLNPFHWF
jgi:hypothetical protein